MLLILKLGSQDGNQRSAVNGTRSTPAANLERIYWAVRLLRLSPRPPSAPPGSPTKDAPGRTRLWELVLWAGAQGLSPPHSGFNHLPLDSGPGGISDNTPVSVAPLHRPLGGPLEAIIAPCLQQRTAPLSPCGMPSSMPALDLGTAFSQEEKTLPWSLHAGSFLGSENRSEVRESLEAFEPQPGSILLDPSHWEPLSKERFDSRSPQTCKVSIPG